MTVEELKTYYSNLLIAQYRDKPNAYATIKALVGMAIMDALPVNLQDAFDLDTAVGAQLDILGKYQGIDRFSFGPNGDFELNDDDFRRLIKMAIVKNSSDSSLKTIVDLLWDYFPGEVQVFDLLNMRIHYIIGVESDNLLYAFINEVLLPKPMGVLIDGIIYVKDLTKLFGFRTYLSQQTVGVPLNSYTSYDSNTRFLTYTDNLQGI